MTDFGLAEEPYMPTKIRTIWIAFLYGDVWKVASSKEELEKKILDAKIHPEDTRVQISRFVEMGQ